MSKGQSLFEVLFVIAITALVLIGVISIATVSLRNAVYSRDQALATGYTHEAMEWIRAERDRSWENIATRSASPNNVWCLITSPPTWPISYGNCTTFIPGTNYKREVRLETITDDTVKIDVFVSWSDSEGDHYASSSAVLTDWRVL